MRLSADCGRFWPVLGCELLAIPFEQLAARTRGPSTGWRSVPKLLELFREVRLDGGLRAGDAVSREPRRRPAEGASPDRGRTLPRLRFQPGRFRHGGLAGFRRVLPA